MLSANVKWELLNIFRMITFQRLINDHSQSTGSRCMLLYVLVYMQWAHQSSVKPHQFVSCHYPPYSVVDCIADVIQRPTTFIIKTRHCTEEYFLNSVGVWHLILSGILPSFSLSSYLFFMQFETKFVVTYNESNEIAPRQ